MVLCATLKYSPGVFVDLTSRTWNLTLLFSNHQGWCFSLFTFIFPIFFLHWSVVLGRVLQNRTVDDNDPTIRYTGQWIKSAVSSLDVGGVHMFTQDPSARATLNFTGESLLNLNELFP